MRHSTPDRRTVADLLATARVRLSAGAHPERAREDAEWLLLHIVQQHDPKRNKAWLMANRSSLLLLRTESRFDAVIERRAIGEPIQYITGETEFYGLPFRVTPDVLIPRPETEHLVEKAIKLAARFLAPRIADIGTGSGCIAVALAHHLPNATITAIDLSASALAVARKNANRNKAAIRFLEGDLLSPAAEEQFNLIVSNPPYVPTTDRDTLAVEVREHEPALALFAGPNGLDIYRRLILQAFACLAPGGFLLLEIGFGQSQAVAALLAASGFRQIEFLPDLQSIPRVACAQRP
jgi:release factor glutamine methyltransferase